MKGVGDESIDVATRMVTNGDLQVTSNQQCELNDSLVSQSRVDPALCGQADDTGLQFSQSCRYNNNVAKLYEQNSSNFERGDFKSSNSVLQMNGLCNMENKFDLHCVNKDDAATMNIFQWGDLHPRCVYYPAINRATLGFVGYGPSKGKTEGGHSLVAGERLSDAYYLVAALAIRKSGHIVKGYGSPLARTLI